MTASPPRARPTTWVDAHFDEVDSLRRNAGDVLGKPVTVLGSALHTDARLYSEYGIPAVLYGAGPRTVLASNARQANVRLALEDRRAATKVVALTLPDFHTPSSAGPHDR